MQPDSASEADRAESVAISSELPTISEKRVGFLATENAVKSTAKKILKSVAQARQSRQRYRSRPDKVVRFDKSQQLDGEDIEEDKEAWMQTGIRVCLKFSCHGTDEMQRILAREPMHEHEQEQAATKSPSAADLSSETSVTPQGRFKTPQPPTLTSYASTPYHAVEQQDKFSHVLPGQNPEIESVPSLTYRVQSSSNKAGKTWATASVDSLDTDTDGSMRSLVPFQRQWVDESRRFNMKHVIHALRAPTTEISALPASFNWFPEAVPVDALFPPGIPISAKEIIAFYPHHIRWKGVALRLVNNAYLGDTVIAMQAFFRAKDTHPLSITDVNRYLRDALKSEMSDFKLSSFQGKPDRNLFTDHLRPTKLVNGSRHDFVVPSFGDLLEGLVHLPVGLDARGLTQCLAWYLSVRDTFTPRLDLNVLHTQSLLRALRTPLKPLGTRNLDKLGLQEWKENGKFAHRRVDDQQSLGANDLDLEHGRDQLTRSRVTIDFHTEALGVDVVVKLRHVLTFPYLAIGGMMCKALELGIEKAEARKAAREAQDSVGDSVGDTDSSQEPGEVSGVTLRDHHEAGSPESIQGPQNTSIFGFPTGYKIPKRSRSQFEDNSPKHRSKKHKDPASAAQGISSAPRSMSITERRHAIAPLPLNPSAAQARQPVTGPSSLPTPRRMNTPESTFGRWQSQTPDRHRSARYSSLSSNQSSSPTYANRFSNHSSPIRYKSRAAPGWGTSYGSRRYGDSAVAGSVLSRGYHGTQTAPPLDPGNDSRSQSGSMVASQPRQSPDPSTGSDPYYRGSVNKYEQDSL